MYVHMDVTAMPDDLYEACRRLNMGRHGSMRRSFEGCREGIWPAKVVVCIDDHTKKVNGWVLAFKTNPYLDIVDLNYYTRYSHRRRGIGTELTRIVKTLYPNGQEFATFPWDDRSESFFSAVGLPD